MDGFTSELQDSLLLLIRMDGGGCYAEASDEPLDELGRELPIFLLSSSHQPDVVRLHLL